MSKKTHVLRGHTRIELILIFAVIAAALIFMPSPTIMSASDNVTLDVNITTTAQIKVLPVSIAWNDTDDVAPGSNGSIKNISVKNVGSLNVTNLYATVDTVDTENQNPLGSGSAASYAAGSLILIRNDTGDLYWHLGRLEWNLSEVMQSEVLDLDAEIVRYGHGWYRLADGNEFLWKVENGTFDSWCNNSDTIFKIKLLPENASNENRDLSTGTAAGAVETNNSNWTVFTFADGPLAEYCMASYYDCTRIYVYKFDKSTGVFPACTNSSYVSAPQNLTPGERYTQIKVLPSIPDGFPGGDTNRSLLTIWASAS